jgi:hypothetical protein
MATFITITVETPNPINNSVSGRKRKKILVLFKAVNFLVLQGQYGARGSVVAKALRYKPEGSGFETR